MALNQNFTVGRLPRANDPSVDKDAKSLLRRFADVSAPSGIAGMGMGGSPADMQTAATAAQNAAAVTAPAAAPARPNPGVFTTDALPETATGRRLAAGVTRYNMDPGNEAAVYTTRGKDGSTIFTDDAGFAARNSAGGLRRGDVNANVYARTQGPRANLEYAPSTLELQGLRRRNFQVLDGDQTQKALLTASSGGDAQTDQGLSDRIDANVLRGRQFALDQKAAANSAALSPRDQIALMRAQTSAAQGDARLKLAQQQLVATQGASDRADAADQRSAQRDFFNQYQNLKANDPEQAENYLFNAIPQDPKEFDQWAATTAGRNVLNTYMTDVLQPQMQQSLFPIIEWGDKRQVPHEGYSNLALGPNGEFQGFINPDGSTNEYPAKGLLGSDNYGSINRFSPSILRRLKRLNTDVQ